MYLFNSQSDGIRWTGIKQSDSDYIHNYFPKKQKLAMGPKKKTIQKTSQKIPQNKMRTIVCSDGKQFKVIDTLLMKHSGLCKIAIEAQKNDEELRFTGVDSEGFEFINEFLQIHKDKDPDKVHFPLKSNQDIFAIMEEADAKYVQRIMAKGQATLLKALNAAHYFDIEELIKRLIAGLTIRILCHTVSELKDMYGIKAGDLNEDELRQQVQQKLNLINEKREQ